jgi:DNA polymerase
VERHLQRHYLDAMGVQVWRLRDSLAAGEEAAPLVDVAQSAGQPREGIAAMDWDRLHAAVRACRACTLCETRTQTVFGVGNRDADLMIVGEAPGADEDRQGEPFVGRAGQLLDRMLASVRLDRKRVYIANILKCRPPGNRDPKPEEAAACRAFLMRQIALVRPRVLLSVGKISAQNLLETDEAVGRLRGRWFELGVERVPLRVTYHPSYLLRSPDQKAKSWQDLTEVMRRLRAEECSGI